MDVSIIIVNYNTKDLTIQCIESIKKHTKDIQYEVIVVDNNSTDGSVTAIRRKFENIIIIQNSINLGFGTANNIGSEKARGKYLLLLNSDTILLNNSIKTFFDFSEKDIELCIGTIGGILRDAYSNEAISFGSFPSKKELIKSALYISNSNNKMTKKSRSIFNKKGYIQVDYVTGADLFIDRNLFIEFKGFDSDFFMYYEETDLQLRLAKSGRRNYIIDNTNIIHLESASFSKGVNNLKRNLITNSMFTYFKKHSDTITFQVFKSIYLFLRLNTLLLRKYTIKENISYLKCIINSK